MEKIDQVLKHLVNKIRDINKVEGFYYITFGNYEIGFVIPNNDAELLARTWQRSMIASSGWGDCSLFTHDRWIRSYSYNHKTLSDTRKSKLPYNRQFTFIVDNSNGLTHNINIDYPSYVIFEKTKISAIRKFKNSNWEYKDKKVINIIVN
jgi:hypothetical protein